MENLLANANRRGANAFGDEARRLPTRPQAPASTHGSQTTRRKGKAVEDLGSGFLGAGAGEKRKAKAIMKRPPIRKSQQHDDLDSESGDDMDLLSSQGDNGSDAGTFVQNNPKGKEKEQERGVWDKSGKFHEYHHNYQPKKTTLPKGLSFKKNKTIPSGAPTSVLPDAYSTATPPVLQEHGTNRSRLSASFRGSPTPKKPTSQTSNGRAQTSGSPSVYNNKPTTRKSIPIAHSSKPARDPQMSENNRPKPRPLRRAVSTQHKPQPIPDVGASDNDTPRSSARRNTVTEPRPFPLLLPDYENVDPKKTRRSSPVEKLYHAAFPLLSPVASPARPAKCPSLTPLALEEKTATVKKTSYQVPRGNGTITQVLPTTPKPVKGKDVCAFPRPSPLSANKEIAGKPKPKQKRYPRPTQEHDSDVEESQNSSEHPRAQPFPMSTQVLNSIGSQDASPTAGPSRLGKRSSSDGSGNEQKRKRTKQDENTEYIPLDDYDYDENDDTLMISPSTDPRTLCPYCDSLLPASPTVLLERLLRATEKKSSRDPRPTNPLGRKAPFAVFIAVCQRHRFESEILPEAERKGWPKEIEWRKIGERVRRMRKRLRALIEDTGEDGNDDNIGEGGGEDILVTVEKAKKRERGSRSKCVFWREVMAEVKKKGSRAVAGVRGQFASFEKTQPGYYGELGSVIIHQTLYDLFPPASIDPSSISPLTVNEFIQRILVPEVGVRLIMEDQGLEREEGMETAVCILRESASYGVAMFPEDGGEWGVGSGGGDGRRGQKGGDGDGDEMGVADRIVMERARKRRKELEEEDGGTELEMEMETETEMGEVQIVSDMGTEDEGRTKPKSKRKRSELTKNEKGKAKEIDTMPIIAPRPKPRPLGKTSSSASVLADDLDTGKTRRSTTAITSGTTYLNLCPTTDDDEEGQNRKDTGKKTQQRRKKSAMLATKRQAPEPVSEERDTDEDTVDMMATPIAKHTRHLLVDNIDDLEETPRISGRSPVSWTPYTTNSPFLPLKAARQRRGNRSETASDVHPPTSESASRNKDSAWLLSDSSQGSSEGM